MSTNLGPTKLSRVEGDRLMVLPAAGVRLGDVERELIEQALDRTKGNITAAALLLGLSRDTLRYRLDKHGLSRSGGWLSDRESGPT